MSIKGSAHSSLAQYPQTSGRQHCSAISTNIQSQERIKSKVVNIPKPPTQPNLRPSLVTMRIGFNILSTILHSFGSRKIKSSSHNTHLPNIFARRDPHATARSAKLRAARSTGRIRNGRTADPVHGGTKAHRRGAPRPLRRCNSVIILRPRTQPQPQPQLPGAYGPEPSFVVPSFPGVDDRQLTSLVQQKLFLDALYAGRQTLLRAKEERREAAKAQKRAEDEEYARLLERDSRNAREAQRRAEDEEYARLLEEDARKAREARRRAEEEEFKRLLEEDRRRAQEAQRRAEAEEAARRERERLEEERRRRAEQEEFVERERRERERQEREQEQQYKKAEAQAESALVERLRVYEETWAMLRSNIAGMKPLHFCDIPWPVFGDVRSGIDVTEERVREFVGHPLHEYMRTPGGGQTKATRLELLRWHPDKFNGKVLNRVVEPDRKAVQDAAAHIVHILNELGAGKQ